MIETLKFPTGEFTHTELAQLNGKTNQQVWTRYQQAIKDGVIVSAGTRASAGKGKPSKLWKVNPNPPTPAAVPATPAPAAVVPPVPPVVVPTEPVVVPASTPAPVIPEVVPAAVVPTEPAKLPEAAPAAAPVVEAPVTVEVLKIEPAPVAEVKPEITVPHVDSKKLLEDARTLTETCPICGKPLLAINDATGIMVWCAQPPEVCSAAENPYGHGRSEKEAFEILCAKFDRQPTMAA